MVLSYIQLREKGVCIFLRFFYTTNRRKLPLLLYIISLSIICVLYPCIYKSLFIRFFLHLLLFLLLLLYSLYTPYTDFISSTYMNLLLLLYYTCNTIILFKCGDKLYVCPISSKGI